jgi:hypothetical protein
MKKYRKDEQNYFVCEECEKPYKNKTLLSKHVIKIHQMSPKEYFDKWIKEENEGLCKICGKKTKLLRPDTGYAEGCCKKHIKLIAYQKSKITMKCHFDVENNFQREECKKTIKSTCLKKFSVDNPNKSKTVRLKTANTCLQRFGATSPFGSIQIREKLKQDNLKKFNVEYSFQRSDVKEKIMKTNLERRGVEYASQDRSVYNKGLKTRLKYFQYLNTDLIYQGSYELDFLEKYYNKIDIKNGLTFKYKLKNKNKVYHSDFYISSLNLIVEIKSSWTLKCDYNIKEKQKSVICNNLNYILILNKNYKQFDCLIERHNDCSNFSLL